MMPRAAVIGVFCLQLLVHSKAADLTSGVRHGQACHTAQNKQSEDVLIQRKISKAACDSAKVDRRRGGGQMCACRRRSGASSTGKYTCVENDIIFTARPTSAPTPPTPPAPTPSGDITVSRRRRDGEMWACRRRAGGDDTPKGYTCQGNAIASCEPNCPRVTVSGRQILVDGKPFHMKGICWNPIGWNRGNGQSDYAGFAERDGDLMAEAGINVIRTYGPLTDLKALDALWKRGIWVMNTVYYSGHSDPSKAAEYVEAVKNHPAILMWVIGNEWNYNMIYTQGHGGGGGLNLDQSIQKLNAAAAVIKSIDSNHPVSTIYGGVPPGWVVSKMDIIDVWGTNIYSGKSFGNMFNQWERTSGKPLYLGEYGADAYNANIQNEDQDAQADATRELTELIVQHSSANEGGVCFGGLLFEFADEWWKDGHGSLEEHDDHGIAPGGGPHPDKTFNEEWWGIVDIARNKRKAYYAYKNVPRPGYSGAPDYTPPAPPAPKGQTCTPSTIDRRRRQVGMCECRRRSGKDALKQGWTCVGPSIVEDIAEVVSS